MYFLGEAALFARLEYAFFSLFSSERLCEMPT